MVIGSVPAIPGTRRRTYIVLGPLIVLLVLWIYLFAAQGPFRHAPNGRGWGADLAMFLTAARVQRAGGNAYDHTLLLRTERAWLHAQHLPLTRYPQNVRVGNPPLFFWALQPLADLPFGPTTVAWTVLLLAALVAGCLGALRVCGWSVILLPTLLTLAMPQTLEGIVFGNVTPLLFAGLMGALTLVARYPSTAGTLLLLAWLKPPLGLPVALLITLFSGPPGRRAALTFLSGSALLLLLTLLFTGPLALLRWWDGLFSYSRTLNIQPDMASLAGLYVRWAPHTLAALLAVLIGVAALAATAWVWTHSRSTSLPFPAWAWLLGLWFLAAPYAHFYDEILLFPAVLLLLGPNASTLVTPRSVLTLALLLFSVLGVSVTPFQIYLLPLPLILITWWVAQIPGPRTAAA